MVCKIFVFGEKFSYFRENYDVRKKFCILGNMMSGPPPLRLKGGLILAEIFTLEKLNPNVMRNRRDEKVVIIYLYYPGSWLVDQ
jgi:hypothetical protein